MSPRQRNAPTFLASGFLVARFLICIYTHQRGLGPESKFGCATIHAPSHQSFGWMLRKRARPDDDTSSRLGGQTKYASYPLVSVLREPAWAGLGRERTAQTVGAKDAALLQHGLPKTSTCAKLLLFTSYTANKKYYCHYYQD